MQNDLKMFQTPVFYARFPVSGLAPTEVDALLENGWSRSDVNLCTTLVHSVEGGWRASLMLRLPLRDFTFKKRFRKVMRRNGRIFQTRIRPFQPSEEKENIWQVFKKNIHHWRFVSTLESHLFKEQNPAGFQSWEVAVYDGSRLVGFSVFDRGAASLASLEAAYDPAYAKYSPGMHTMLAEIEYAMQQGLSFYYPGFIPKDTPMFEYKLRPGGLEFFRIKTQEWLPWDRLEKSDWVFDEVFEKLRLLQAFLACGQRKARLATGHFLNWPGIVPSLTDYNFFLLYPYPLVEKPDLCIAIGWNPFAAHFQVFQARLFTDYQPGNDDLEMKIILVYAVSESTYCGAFENVFEVLNYLPPSR
ncbi:MAG: GNAT family N-acetyltransferase [Saprospiraceae bacterium]|nr:MAG: GNAT family N-acetyltransferase [Saprospiraceae bacterium]